MKKIFVFISAFILILTACGESYGTGNYELPIFTRAKLKGSDFAFNAKISEADFLISFDEGHALYGTELYFSEKGGVAKIGEYTREVRLDAFPAQKAFIKAVRAVCNQDARYLKTEYGRKYTIDETVIMVYYGTDRKTITDIETEEHGRRFYFAVEVIEPYEVQSGSAG